MDTRVIIGGTSLVLVTGAAAVIQVAAPELMPVLCPLSLLVGSAAYMAVHPDVRARVAGLLPAPRTHMLPDYSRTVGPPVSLALDVQAQVLAALAQPVATPVGSTTMGGAQAQPTRSSRESTFVRDAEALVSAPPMTAEAPVIATPHPTVLPPAALPLDYAPGMAERWIASTLPVGVIEMAVAHSTLTPRALVQRLHEMLLRGSLIVSRLTLGCAMHEADHVGDWTAALVICDRAPDAVLNERLRAHFLTVAAHPYSQGGTALLVVLAQPAKVEPASCVAVPLADPAPVVLPKHHMPVATAVAIPDVDATPGSDNHNDSDTDGDPDDDAALETYLPFAAPNAAPVVPPNQFLDHERASQRMAPAHHADLASARAIWTPGANLPQLHFGVHPHTGVMITGPLEPTCLFVPSQRGKTTLLMYLLHQTLMACDTASGDGILPWFMTTKWQDTTMHGVHIGRWLRQAYNLAHFDAPCGIEADGIGTLRMLRMLERELNARLTPGTTRPRTPIVAMVDEWSYTVAALGQKRFKQEPRRKTKAVDADDTPFDPLAIEDETPKSPLDAASLDARRIIRQGFGERMVLFLATQDGQVQNNGDILNTGVLGSFSTYLCHTECDAPTFKIIAKGDATRLKALNALRETWSGWIYVREHRVLPFTFPHVTNATIDAWLAERPAALRSASVAPVATSVASASRAVPELASAPGARRAPSSTATPEDWPESVRSYIVKLPSAQLRALIAACAQCGVVIPLRTTEVQRHTMLGLQDPAQANERLLRLLTALATRTQSPMSANQIAAVVFGSTGRTSADVGRAVRARQGE